MSLLSSFFPRSQQESNMSFSGPIPRHLGCTHTWQIIGALYDIQKAFVPFGSFRFLMLGSEKDTILTELKGPGIQVVLYGIESKIQIHSPPRLHGY